MEEFEYDHEYYLLIGSMKGSPNVSSWGYHMNITYPELVSNVTDVDELDLIELWNPGLNLERKLFPRFGICLKSTNYSLKRLDIYLWEKIDKDVMVFLTEDSLKTNYGIQYSSQVGDKIKIEPEKANIYTFKISISIYDISQSADNGNCVQDDGYDFAACVDDKTFDDLNIRMGCVPMWLSERSPCTLVDNQTMKEYFEQNYVFTYFWLLDTPAQRKCKLPCRKQVSEFCFS